MIADKDYSDSLEDDDDSSSPSNIPGYNYQYTSETDAQKTDHINTERVKRIESAMKNVWNIINKYGNSKLPSLDPKEVDVNCWKIDDDSPWSDVPAALKEIASVRNEMHKVLEIDNHTGSNTSDSKKSSDWWAPYLNKTEYEDKTMKYTNSSRSRDDTFTEEEQMQFEQVHMEWATNAFAEELEALRNGTLEQKFGTKKKSVEALDLNQSELSFVVAKQKSTNDDKVVKEVVDVQVLAVMLRSGGNVFSDIEKRMLLRARQRGGIETNHDSEVLPTIHEIRRRNLGYL